MTSNDIILKCLPSSVKPTLVIFAILVPATLCTLIELNCSEPNQPALLKALTPLFNLNAIRPVMNASEYTDISTFFTMYGILGVDEKAQLLLTYLWVESYWVNKLVSWDPIQCGSRRITLPRKKLWVPDILIEEFVDENTAPTVPYVYLYSNGTVHDSLPLRVVSACNLDIYTFPFDIQKCSFTFTPYLTSSREIVISMAKTAETITVSSKQIMTTMGEWELLDITAHKRRFLTSQTEFLDQLVFHVTVRRRATLYVVNLLIPSCFLITVDLFSFLLPPLAVDRSSFKMTLILGYTVFLLIMNDLLPVTGNAIPLLNVFFSLCLGLMVASLLETIFITNLLNGSEKYSPVPHWIHVVVLQFLGSLVCLPLKAKKKGSFDLKPNSVLAQRAADAEHPEVPVVESKALQELRSLGRDLQDIRVLVDQKLGENKSAEEWIQVGFIIDRLLFGIYIIFITISFITIIVVWVIAYNQ